MKVSEARIAANRANATRCKGPTSELGKSISRRNSFKHGLTGAGVVVPEGDQAEVERRVEALHDELRPGSGLGSLLIRKIASLSVRSERAAERENAAIAERARDAADAFDEERGRRVDGLFLDLATDPRAALRNLRRMPEGVDRLLESWRGLRARLDHPDGQRWGSQEWGRLATLTGESPFEACGTRLMDLSRAVLGEFDGLAPDEGGDLDDEARRDWARGQLRERIDARVAELEAHRTTLDLARIAQDRLEAPSRSTFDDSKEASLARRYEADADRGFYKALKEFRQVEAEAQGRAEAEPGPSEADRPGPRMDSFREATPTSGVERPSGFPEGPAIERRAEKGAKRRAPRPDRPHRPPA